MNRLSKNKGEIRIPAGINVWQHELSTANALAGAGLVVEFLPTKDTVQAFLLQKFKQQKTIKKLLFINRKHQVIDISKLI